MNRHTILTVVLVTSPSWVGMGARATPFDQAGQKKEQSKQPAKKTGEGTLTGCIDQQDGQYVLIDDRKREPIADLVADGFPTEGFAKHLGHSVTVRGTSSPEGQRPVFRVRTIQPISDTCGPQQ